MASIVSLIFSVIFAISLTNTSGFNITRLLDNHPEFSTFEDLLKKTGVANAINTHKAITVLVVANNDLDGLEEEPHALIRDILATHVLMDYFDMMKFSDLSKNTALISNLFRSSGHANKEQGLLNVTTYGSKVVFGSAIKGAPHDSKMVRTVAANPYTISVIQISKPIIAPGLNQNAPISSSSPMAAPPLNEDEGEVAEGPTKEEDKREKEEGEAVEGPTEEEEEEEGPEAEESEAEGPIEDVIDYPTPAPGPTEKETEPADEPRLVENKNAGARGVIHVGVMVTCLLGLVSLAQS